MAEPAPWCKDCQEITRSQRECINCGGPVEKATAELPDAPGGEGNAGPGPHEGWHCGRCTVLWDGGARYGFACAAHGGSDEPNGPKPTGEIKPGQPLGNFPGHN